MASCPGRIEDVSALLDGELEPEDELEIRRHLDECDVCRAWRAHFESIANEARRWLPPARAPRLLGQRLESERMLPSRRRRAHGRRRLRIVIGAVAIAGAGALLFVVRPPDGDSWSARLVADHARLVVAGARLAVTSSDPQEVSSALSERLPFRVAVSEIEDAQLLGGQDCSLPGGRAAYLQYQIDGERVSVFVRPGTDGRAIGESVRPGCVEISADETLCTFPGPRGAPQQTIAVVARAASTAETFRQAGAVVSAY